MSTENFKKAGEIFQNAIEIDDPAKREDYLNNACEGDKNLRAEVAGLLEAHEKSGDFLEVSAVAPISAPIEGPGTKIGRYELIELLGEGGMGLVYLAQQQEPVRRKVALKIVKLGMDTMQVVARFEAERQTLALLEHPNIARVFDAGTTETGRPYFVMEYVEGLSITKYCDEQKLTVEQRLNLFRQACEAVHHAHQKGIIHRDIKPSNILVSIQDGKPVPKIIDFGIAKAIAQPLTGETSYTEHGQLLGTPEYMSPEQAGMDYQQVDTRSDIYSLGVVLYELLAGVTPYDAKKLREGGIDRIQEIICEDEPGTPSARLTGLGDKAGKIAESRRTQIFTLTRRLHRELEWIPMKAMRKDRTRRYRSASELADDIQNYLSGSPLIAGPESNVYRARKFVRKHAGSVASAALVAVVIILGLIISTVFSFKAEKARGQEAAARIEAEQARDKEAALRAEVEKALGRAEKAEAIAEERSEDYRRALYVNSIQLAHAKHQQGDTKAVRTLLEACPDDLRGWEWNHLDYIADQARIVLREASNAVMSPALSPDGKLIASGGWGKSVKVWDEATGSKRMDLTGHEGAVWCVAFSPDGKRLVSGSADKTIKVWDVQSGRELKTLHGHNRAVSYVTCSPDGKGIASSEYGPIKIWDVEKGVEITNMQCKSTWIGKLAFSPDGKHIASYNKDAISVWDTTSGAELITIPSAHKLWVTCVAYSPDGKSIVSCGWDSNIKVWDASTGKQTMILRSGSQRLNCVGYDASGKYIVAPNQGNNISVWDSVTGEVVTTLAGHEASILSVSFSLDGKKILSSSEDKTIRVWDTLWSKERMLIHTDSFTLGLAYSPDGRRLATGGMKGGVTIWDAAAGIELTTIPVNASWIFDMVFSPDGSQLASGGASGAGMIWDVTTGAQLMSFSEPQSYGKGITAMAFSLNGNNIVAGNQEGIVRLYDTKTGKELMRLPGGRGQTESLAYFPNGSRILSGFLKGPVKVWDAGTGTEVLTIGAEGDTLYGRAEISHDGRYIVAGTMKGNIILWDAQTGKQVRTWLAHSGFAQQVCFSPDDRRLASMSRADSTVKVWETATGRELMTLVPQQDVYEVAFSPDGSTIAALSVEGIILWETAEPAGGGYEQREIGQMARKLTTEIYKKHGSWRDAIDELRADRTLDEQVRKLALRIANSRKWEDASKIVDELYEKHGLYHDVLAELQAEKGFDEPDRKLALQIANCYLWYDAQKLGREVLRVVRKPDTHIEAYREALAKAQQANSWDSNDSRILDILGYAQYRTGLYEEALRTFKRVEELMANEGKKQLHETVGIKAMTLYQLGRIDEAKSTLEELRTLLKEERFAKNETLKALLVEAETLIAGTE